MGMTSGICGRQTIAVATGMIASTIKTMPSTWAFLPNWDMGSPLGGSAGKNSCGLHVEAEVHHVAVGHDVLLALDAQLAGCLAPCSPPSSM